MEEKPKRKSGIYLLIEQYKNIFRIPENINFYSDEDFREAERKFLKFVLKNGKHD